MHYHVFNYCILPPLIEIHTKYIGGNFCSLCHWSEAPCLMHYHVLKYFGPPYLIEICTKCVGANTLQPLSLVQPAKCYVH